MFNHPHPSTTTTIATNDTIIDECKPTQLPHRTLPSPGESTDGSNSINRQGLNKQNLPRVTKTGVTDEETKSDVETKEIATPTTSSVTLDYKDKAFNDDVVHKYNTSVERCEKVEDHLFGMNRCKIDQFKAMQIIVRNSSDHFMRAYKDMIIYLAASERDVITESVYKWEQLTERHLQVAAVDHRIPQAQFLLGCAYEWGISRLRNEGTAMYWYMLAARGGHVPAKVHLGDCYRKGLVASSEKEAAIRLYIDAASKGHAKAQFCLGEICSSGPNSQKHICRLEAVKRYRDAANQGHLGAQMRLGQKYFQGIGVQQDVELGLQWIERAGNGGYARASEWLGYVYDRGARGVNADEAKAAEWLEKAAIQRQASKLQQQVSSSFDPSFEVHMRAAQKGNVHAEYHIARLYENGTKKPPSRA